MRFTVKSEVGVVRSENQDRAGVFQANGIVFAILCDGMGGHRGGSYAAEAALSTFESSFMKNSAKLNQQTATNWFTETLQLAVSAMEVFGKNEPALLDMGTTLTAVLIFPDKKSLVFNIGDSRTYFFNGILHQITEDQNLRNHYITHYNYSPEEASTIVGATALTSALGPQKKKKVDVFSVALEQNIKYIVLTSDGVHDFMSHEEFETVLINGQNIEQIAENLIDTAINNKSSDNLTNVVLDLWG